jgi:thiamine-monophosphate kinase
MKPTNVAREIRLIDGLARAFGRSPHQLNARHESDAELLRLPGTDLVLAVTADDIAEEVESGLYRDPFLIGWMAVLINASDLAAVGARPVGLLLNETLPPDASERFLASLQRGIRDASEACGIPVLGGDTNFGTRLHIGATAIGLIETGAPLTRRGCEPGDVLYASGPLGLGTAFALLQLLSGGAATSPPATNGDSPLASLEFLPQPRLTEGRILGSIASACMDTSDGAIATLDELMRVNGVGFRLDPLLDRLLDRGALQAARAAGLPAWMMLAGPHGEFELIFTVRPTRLGTLERAARRIGWRPIRLGRAVPEPGLRLRIEDAPRALDATRIRDLFGECGGDPLAYRAALLAFHEELMAAPAATAA